MLDNMSRVGSHVNRSWLESDGLVNVIEADIREPEQVTDIVHDLQPEIIFHLAGQVAMTTSIANPRLDFEVNTLGTFNVLEAIRTTAPNCRVIYSSTNKVYGDLEYCVFEEDKSRYINTSFPVGCDENIKLDFHSPYGTSKGAADQYVLDYARIFGLNTTVLRHSSIYGGRQFATKDQGWLGWFIAEALRIEKDGGSGVVQISGNGKQVRDLLHSTDCVDLYLRAGMSSSDFGSVFNIGGGVDNSMSLLELLDFLSNELKISIEIDHLPARESDQKVFIADIGAAMKQFDWSPKVAKYDGIREMVGWVRSISERVV